VGCKVICIVFEEVEEKFLLWWNIDGEQEKMELVTRR
jgi:hypothetical protein